MLGVLLGTALGLVSGVRHAFEPDHVAAVTSIAAGERRASRIVGFATWWGVGHGAMLVAVGGGIFVAKGAMPERMADALELVVACALVALGVRALWVARATDSLAPLGRHAHGESLHEHAGPASHVHVGRATFARLPFIVGLVHGLSGSGALTALAMSKLMSLGEGLLFIVLYAAGATLGMAMLAGVAGIPLARLARRPLLARGVVLASGALSLAVGVVWAAPIVARHF